MELAAFLIFSITYAGIAFGRLPGFALDRVGVALIGAIAMVVCGVVSAQEAARSIDMPTLLLLYALMIISAQLRLGGFYTWLAGRLTFFLERPRFFLFVVMMASAVLSAVLANDIVCFAFTPVLAVSLTGVRLNPMPFLIGLAVSSNIGSAATIIGNPQNMLIGQVGRLDFASFFYWCGPPCLAALIASYFLIVWLYRNTMRNRGLVLDSSREAGWQAFNRWQTTKGILAVGVLVALFFTRIPREISAVGIAGLLLCSRKIKTREMLGLVDWHLITLFAALFVIVHGISRHGILGTLLQSLASIGFAFHNLPQLAGLSAVLSNLVSNVPAVMLLLGSLDAADPYQWYTLAVSSTFAGNLILIGSIANLIVVEQAALLGIRLEFKEHAAAGVPVTVVSLLVLLCWIGLHGGAAGP